MGPLIPQGLINGDLNFFFAFIIGIAFGFILEQAGFSSSRKLAGVFYGYDFVVLKVFFTAGITAAIGLFFFNYFGWVDFNFLYINPLYLWSALVGGIIMGFGFILGGFCPGTSLAAAVIGKIDAMIFILGMFLGIFIFGIYYPVFEPLHTGHYLGTPFIFDTIGISMSWFLFFLVFMAIAAFFITQQIENNTTRFKELLYTQKVQIGFPLLFLIALAFLAVIIPQERKSFLSEPSSKDVFEKVISTERYISTEKAAYSIVNDISDLHFVDVRSSQEYKVFHLPGAINIPIQDILNPANKNAYKHLNKTTVLYSNGSSNADKAWFFLYRSGYSEIKVLHGGLNAFFDRFFEEDTIKSTGNIQKTYNIKFAEKVRRFFNEGGVVLDDGKDKEVPKATHETNPTIKGGC